MLQSASPLNNGIIKQILEDFQNFRLFNNKLSDICINSEISENWKILEFKHFKIF